MRAGGAQPDGEAGEVGEVGEAGEMGEPLPHKEVEERELLGVETRTESVLNFFIAKPFRCSGEGGHVEPAFLLNSL